MNKKSAKPSFCVDSENYFINYGETRFYLDKNDWISIRDFDKTFKLDDSHTYPYYKYNNKKFTYLEYLFKFNADENIYHFKNKNIYDLRRANVVCYPTFYSTIIDNYVILDYINGHYSTLGQSAYKIKNCMWKINENNKEYLLMYCEKNTLCKLCNESYNKILDYETTIGKKLTWYKSANGYIQAHNLVDNKIYYIHQIITGCYGNGQGTKNISVDHIDRDPLNNSWENLRVATREEQDANTKGIMGGTKRARKTSARPLPEGITHDMMRKYVVYYQDYADKEKKRLRQYFKIESHPKLDKKWIGCKSNTLTIIEKLNQINKIVDDLDKDIYPSKTT
jgi:hypothetical protein